MVTGQRQCPQGDGTPCTHAWAGTFLSVSPGLLPKNEQQGLTTILLRARNQSEHAVVLPDPLSNFSVCAIRRPVL